MDHSFDASQIDARAQALLAQLSPSEKLSMLTGSTPFWSGMVSIALDDASHRRPWPSCTPCRLGLPGLQFVDGPRGVVLAGGATTFPVPIARGATWDPELEARIGAAIALEARSCGANWIAAVCVNLLRHPGWGRAQETYGEDPVHVGAMGAALTRGLELHAAACIKHFALNSIDRSRFFVNVNVSRRVLHELYLPQFRDCVEAGASSVMTAYNRVNGTWCSEHVELLDSILKRRWNFRGFVVSDFIFGIRDGVAAVRAGLDLEMPFPMILPGTVPEAVSQDRLDQARVDDAVLRQLRVQLQLSQAPVNHAHGRSLHHLALAREAARKSIVLLQNHCLATGIPALPLRDLTSLAVIGPLAAAINLGDRGSSDTRPPRGAVVTPLDGLRKARPELPIHHAGGRHLGAAASLAARCDAAVVVVGLDWQQEGEHIQPSDIAPILEQIPPPDWLLRSFVWPYLRGSWVHFARLLAWFIGHAPPRPGGDFSAGDRITLTLPEQQLKLIRTVASVNPRTVVALMGGGAILCEEWRHQVPAVLLLWYPGEQGGHALAEVLFGAVSPSGRLPFSLPVQASHLPFFDPQAADVDYDLWHGYRLLSRLGEPAAFPFGFGLSYSRFEHSGVRLTHLPAPDGTPQAIQLAVTVTNCGAMEAADVLQVYLEAPGRCVERPRRTLVAFARVCLEPQQQEHLCVPIPLRRLAYFDTDRDAFMLEEGVHRLVVARHVADQGLAVDLRLEARLVPD
jgi:beta-glucosidase